MDQLAQDEYPRDRSSSGTQAPRSALQIAVMIPCFNEEVAIGQTVQDFRAALPSADIYVFDNNSSDGTADAAQHAGAIVRSEPHQGKGSVVRRMFADVEADIYVMINGDATYDAASVREMVQRLRDENLDMVSGARKSDEQAAYRTGHRWGNKALTGLVRAIFGATFHDMLTGYRVFSRRFVKSFPATSHGFEIETELTVHALQLRLPVAEMPTRYSSRPDGSVSKLSTYRDGFRILRMIGVLVKEEKPLAFFSAIAALLLLPSSLLFGSVLIEFLQTEAVPRFPTLIASISGFLLAALSLLSGLILDSVARGRMEQRRFAYLQAS